MPKVKLGIESVLLLLLKQMVDFFDLQKVSRGY
jgi:hypothetical protein